MTSSILIVTLKNRLVLNLMSENYITYFIVIFLQALGLAYQQLGMLTAALKVSRAFHKLRLKLFTVKWSCSWLNE